MIDHVIIVVDMLTRTYDPDESDNNGEDQEENEQNGCANEEFFWDLIDGQRSNIFWKGLHLFIKRWFELLFIN